MQWQLRYRSPLAPTKGVDDVTISTTGEDYDPPRAREVADHWLATAVSHPSTRFISLRPVVVCTEEAMRAAQKQALAAPPKAPSLV